jgi:16S rRNA G966 N2-methylase RsmD
MVQKTNLLKWSDSHGFRFTHDWFRFPGKFHPPLVEHILRSVNPSGVLDPMAGVGTVAVEAKAAGIPSFSLDVDPVSAFFINVKTTPIATATLVAAWQRLSKSFESFRRSEREIEIRKFRDIRIDAMREDLASVEASDFERLTYWFRRYALVDFARIDHAIWNGGLPHRSDVVRRFFLGCLLSSIRRISFADPSPVSGLEITKHMKERIENGYSIDVFGEFERRVELAIQRMDNYTAYLHAKGTYNTPTYCEQADCADLLKLNLARAFKADLIFFSPPYCNAIEYWRRHRLEYFLGRFLDEKGAIALHRKSIGRTTVGETAKDLPKLGYPPTDKLQEALLEKQRPHKARVLWQYFNDMKKRLEVFRDYLPSRGHCIIVVGDSETGGMRIPTARTIVWLGEQLGFNHIKTSRYKIKNRVMQFPVKSNSKIERESIIVLQKP